MTNAKENKQMHTIRPLFSRKLLKDRGSYSHVNNHDAWLVILVAAAAAWCRLLPRRPVTRLTSSTPHAGSVGDNGPPAS